MTIKKICFILFVACLPSYHVFSQIDKEFWFAAPAVTYSSGAGKSFFKFTSLGQSATVTLSVPSNSSIAPITVTVPANGTKFVDVTSLHSKILAGTPNVALNTGIKIVSDEAITAYYEYSITTNPEIYSLKGKNALGNQFTIVSQNFWENSQTTSPSPKNGFLLVATEDSTIIRITPSKDIVGHTAGTTFNVLLNKGQVYYAEATGGLAVDHLFGSNVSSTKPIAVTTFDDFVTNATYGTCRDLMGDQMVPDDRAGTEFIAVKGFLNNPDKLFIIATQNNTRVFNNGVFVAILQKGEIFSINVTTSNYVRTSLPSLAYHVTGTNCEVGSAILPPLNCTGTQKVGFTRTYTGQFGIILIVRRGGEGNFTIASSGVSKSIPSNLFSTVPGTGGNWMAANIPFDTLNVIPNQGYIVTNTTSSFHLGTVDGFGGRTGGTYAYFSNFSNPPISTTTTSPVCVNTSFGITVTTPTSATYNWIRPNGTKISNTFSNKLTIPFSSFKDTGNYLVQAKQNGCLSPWDTVKVALYNLPVASASARKATCVNGVAQNNASIELFNGLFSDTNSLKYDFVKNSVYNGNKTYATATLLGQSSVISNLPNPTILTRYTIRFFSKHGCTIDTTVSISPVNCFCNSSQLSVKEFPSDSSFSSGLGAPGSLDPNWEVSDALYKGKFPQSISTLPSPNSRFIHFQKPIIQPTCTPAWANSSLLPAPFNKANWISGQDIPCINEQEKYTYRYYRKTFVLPCNCGGNIDYPINQLNLRLNAYADNRILAIYINGENINAPYLPSSLTTFRTNDQARLIFPGPWHAGVNTIEILIENGTQSTVNANLEGLLVTGSQTLPSLFKIKPKAGSDFSQCYTIDSVDLADATNSQKWSVLSSPKTISLNKYNGIAKGLSKAGKYSFLLTDTATNACSDTIIVTIFDTPPPVHKDTSVCEHVGKISPLSSGNKVKWYFSQTGGSGVDTLPLQDVSIAGTYNYWYTQNINNCESPRANSKIIVNGIPSKPSASTPILYKQGDATIPLKATGTGTLKWYTSSSGGSTSLIAPTPSSLISGTYTFYVSQTINNCEGPRAAIEVKIIDLTKPGTIGNSQIVCDTNTPQLLKEIIPSSGASSGGITYVWEISNDSINWDSVGNTLNFQPAKITSSKWYRRKETDNVYGLYLINTGFEPPFTPSISKNTYRLVDDALIDGWNTTATDKLIEVWGTDYRNVDAAEGKQFVELNATQNSRLYQYVYLKKGSIISWSFKHRGRTAGIPDIAQLNIYSSNGASKLIVLDTANTDLSQWVDYSDTWKVTLPDGIYQFSFEAISTGSGNKTVGNFLDDINIVASQFSNAIKLTYQKTPSPNVSNVVYCQNNLSKPLVATGTGTLNWYQDSTGGLASTTAPTPSTILADTFSYYVSQTIKTCESPRKEIIVLVKPLPSLPSVKDSILCQQSGNITLTAVGNDLTWYSAQNGGLGSKINPTFNTNIPDTVSKWVSQTVNACEGSRKEIKLQIKVLPAAPTSKDTLFCQQIGNISFVANGNDLTWYSASNGGLGSKITPSFDANLPDTMSRWVSQTVNNCEGPRKEVKLQIKALPAAPTSKDSILCKQTGNISLMAKGNDLTWYTTPIGGLGSKIAPSFDTNTPDTVSRWVSQTVNACEGPRKEIKLQIKALPATPTFKDSILCQQTGTISLIANGNDLTWYITQNGGVGSKITPSFDANLPVTLSRWVSQTVNNCEGPRQEVKLQIKALPVPPAVWDTSLCQISGSLVFKSVGTNLKWYKSGNPVPETIAPIVNTSISDTIIYFVSQTQFGCESIKQKNSVLVKEVPPKPIKSDTTFCMEKVSSSSSFKATGQNLLWYKSAIGGLGSINPPVFKHDSVGKKVVYATQTINGCESQRELLFSEVLALPNLNITGAASSPYCAKSNVTLKASGAVDYRWKTPSDEFVDVANLNIPSFELKNQGTYVLTGKGSNNCSNSTNVTLSLKNLPSISADPVSVCEKKRIELKANSSGNVVWKTPSNQKIVGNVFSLTTSKYSDSGIYKVISESAGCTDSIEVNVSVLNCPPIANNDKYSIFSDERIITNMASHPISNDSDPNDSLQTQDFTILNSPSNGSLTIEKDGNWQYKPNHTFEGTEIVEYRICDRGKPVLCTTAKIVIEVKKRPAFFPDVFSPNGDGVNDTYIIYFTDETVKASLYVYNRWGDLVYKSSDYKNNWAGTCEVGGCLGRELPVGTYFVVAEMSNGQKNSTYVTLSR